MSRPTATDSGVSRPRTGPALAHVPLGIDHVELGIARLTACPAGLVETHVLGSPADAAQAGLAVGMPVEFVQGIDHAFDDALYFLARPEDRQYFRRRNAPHRAAVTTALPSGMA